VAIVLLLLQVSEFIAAVGFDIVQIGSLKQTGKKLDEFLLFLRAAATPLRTERAPGHLREIKPLIDQLFEFVPSLILFALALQLGILEDRQELVCRLTNLVSRHSCGHPYRLH
jgi:hypothetical protein